MIFWNFACFGEILSLFQKPIRRIPEILTGRSGKFQTEFGGS